MTNFYEYCEKLYEYDYGECNVDTSKRLEN